MVAPKCVQHGRHSPTYINRPNTQNERFARDFLRKSYVKSSKQAFGTRLLPKFTCQVSKTSVSHETSWKSTLEKSAKQAFRTRLPPKVTMFQSPPTQTASPTRRRYTQEPPGEALCSTLGRWSTANPPGALNCKHAFIAKIICFALGPSELQVFWVGSQNLQNSQESLFITSGRRGGKGWSGWRTGDLCWANI